MSTDNAETPVEGETVRSNVLFTLGSIDVTNDHLIGGLAGILLLKLFE